MSALIVYGAVSLIFLLGYCTRALLDEAERRSESDRWHDAWHTWQEDCRRARAAYYAGEER